MAKQNGNSDAQGVIAKAFNMDALLKGAKVTLSDDMIEGQFRGAKVKKNVTTKDIERVSTGQVNSAIRVGEVFRIVGIKMIAQDVQNTGEKDLLLLIIENPKGDQRAIYSSSLFRSNPTADSERNKYDDDVKSFDRGILQGTNGAGAPKMLEKLYGNGTDFIKVEDEIIYTTEAIRQVDGNPALNQKAGDKFDITQRVFKLAHISEEEARTAAE